jgi:hypothetical protein
MSRLSLFLVPGPVFANPVITGEGPIAGDSEFKPTSPPGFPNAITAASFPTVITIDLDENYSTTQGEAWTAITGEGNLPTTGLGHWTISLSTVPEPSSAALASIAVAGGLVYRWRRRCGAQSRQGPVRTPGETE